MLEFVLNLPLGEKGDSWMLTRWLASSSWPPSVRLRFVSFSFSLGLMILTEKRHSARLSSARLSSFSSLGLLRELAIGEEAVARSQRRSLSRRRVV
jgi:hypothetical protein